MKILASVLAVGLLGASAFAQQAAAVHGWIEDGIVHTAGTSSTDVKKSIAGGAPYVFVDDKSKNVWRIDNPDVVKGHEGHHVEFTGSMDKVAMTIHIDKLSMLKNQKPGPEPEAVGH
ncbi:hypothetical protein SAMN05421770_103316 [Granulicella rosea]|uniref:DUF5666 domain-containing protein n=1 Tax=Granulicella rosea TaxID=474952 RepID=A0A239IVW5_9BACT|nr:hypothetical protein [Granulicella rosea]SNS97906.1 hypothetical protein SAMN05421770_103316 [Granulicella rosea]